MISGDKKAYLKAKESYMNDLVKERDSRVKSVSSFISNVSKGSHKTKASRSINLSLTGNRRY